MPLNVVIVEDSELIQKWLERLLAGIPGVAVVGLAAAEDEAIEMIDRLRPRLVTLDVALSPGNGFNVLKVLRERGHDCKALMLTNQDLAGLRPTAQKYGADGLYDKSLDVAALVEQVRLWAEQAGDRLPQAQL
jgi:DNA-binding NarL/FixJ family response regulator